MDSELTVRGRSYEELINSERSGGVVGRKAADPLTEVLHRYAKGIQPAVLRHRGGT